MHKIPVILCGILLSGMAFGQERINAGGFFPKAQLSIRSGEKWIFVGKIESRHGIVYHNLKEEADRGHYHERTVLQGFADYKLGPLTRAAAGYQYRWNGDSGNNHRAVQQITYVQPKNRIRLGHRLRTDQTFDPLAPPEFRLRYRLVAELPLEGYHIDPGEWYFITSNEPIFGVRGGTFSIENRLMGSLGHYFSNRQKLEGGIDYRTDSFLDGGLRQRFWFKVGWFVNI